MKRRPCPDMRAHEAEVLALVKERSIANASGCWEWTGHRNSLGYGEACFDGRVWIVTRLLWCATKGAFDPVLDICHECDNPPCVNPGHIWPGSRSANIKDSVEKERHFLAEITHCKRGHPLEGDNLYLTSAGKRACKACQRGRQRVAGGWPEDLAYSLPIQKLGYRPEGIGARWTGRLRTGPKTHCVNGHPLSGDNLYIVPSDGRRQCRACKLAVVQRIAAERRADSATRAPK